MKSGKFAVFLLLCGFLAACTASPAMPEEDLMKLEITSPAFAHEQGIPELYTCKGQDISPPLQWAEPPAGTKSFVLIMDDPDAPVGVWDHWLLFNLPADTRQLPEDIPTLSPGTLVGRNSWGRDDYGGPCPPGGARHRYFFKLYALDIQLDLQGGAKKTALETAMQGHILAQGQLIGIYKP
jgi:Raf kinase inhibitor-like YbhB/YbcL family protein